MSEGSVSAFAYHQMLVVVATAVCLFGTWVGMRHFARARATAGPTRIGWLFMASVVTGAALWASTFISILALDPSLTSGFEPVATGLVLLIAIVACAAGFAIGSRPAPALAPELGGLVVGAGIIAMHFVGLRGWHVEGTVSWNIYGLALAFLLGLGLSALSVNRANRPVTRYCRHGAAIVLAFMIVTMHYALTASATTSADTSLTLPPYLIPAHMLCIALVMAVLLVMGSGFSTYVIDLRTRTESADRIHQLSFNDTMTGLPNRIAFNEKLSFDLADAHEKAEKVAVFSIDIDGFKDVNDVFGHSAGDLVLIELASRLRSVSGAGEFVARQNGDEFLALQVSSDQPRDAQAFAERLSVALSMPFRVGSEQVQLTASIGYSVFPVDTRDRDNLISNAKLAMHRGKSSQSGTICCYDQQMDDVARARRALARDLLAAAGNGELALHYQLQTSLRNGEHDRRGSAAALASSRPAA